MPPTALNCATLSNERPFSFERPKNVFLRTHPHPGLHAKMKPILSPPSVSDDLAIHLEVRLLFGQRTKGRANSLKLLGFYSRESPAAPTKKQQWNFGLLFSGVAQKSFRCSGQDIPSPFLFLRIPDLASPFLRCTRKDEWLSAGPSRCSFFGPFGWTTTPSRPCSRVT